MLGSSTPADFARHALKRLGELHLEPTPENYSRFYNEAAHGVASAAFELAGGNGPLPSMVSQFNSLVDRAVATTEQLAHGLEHRNEAMEESWEGLSGAAGVTATAHLVRSVVDLSRDIHLTVKASQAELLDTRRSLAGIKAELEESRKLLGQDPLTGTDNRRAMDAILAREMARSRRDREPLSVAMVDIDHFKKINDSHGHSAGDAALVHLTRLARALLRGNDAFIRYGGEEFLLVLPETGLQCGVSTAHRLLNMLRRQPLVYEGKSIPMTLSAGVATLGDEDTQDVLIRKADAALYEAKRAGRDRVNLFEGFKSLARAPSHCQDFAIPSRTSTFGR